MAKELGQRLRQVASINQEDYANVILVPFSLELPLPAFSSIPVEMNKVIDEKTALKIALKMRQMQG